MENDHKFPWLDRKESAKCKTCGISRHTQRAEKKTCIGQQRENEHLAKYKDTEIEKLMLVSFAPPGYEARNFVFPIANVRVFSEGEHLTLTVFRDFSTEIAMLRGGEPIRACVNVCFTDDPTTHKSHGFSSLGHHRLRFSMSDCAAVARDGVTVFTLTHNEFSVDEVTTECQEEM